MQTPRRFPRRAAVALALAVTTAGAGSVVALAAGPSTLPGAQAADAAPVAAGASPSPDVTYGDYIFWWDGTTWRWRRRGDATPTPTPTSSTTTAPSPTPTATATTTTAPAPTPTATTTAPAPSPTATTTTAATTSTSSPRYLSWIAIGYIPTEAELQAAVGKYDTIVLNSDRAAIATRMKQLDPDVTVLAYEDLSSVRTYDGDKTVVTGVSYTQALANDWIAKDVNGNNITWNGYEGHLQTKVWDSAYRTAWTNTVANLMKSSPFDGVYADNDMASLRYYSSQVIAGTSGQQATDDLIRQGVDALIHQAGPAVNAVGKKFVVNISDGRLDLAHWDSHSKYGGGQEENFMAWSMTDWHPNVYDWGNTGWTTQTDLMARGPKSLAVTNAAAGDMRTLLYGYASFLMKAHPGDAWTGRDQSGYNSAKLPQETKQWLGLPSGPAWTENGLWLRSFQGGLVIVNPQTSDRTYTAAPAAIDSNGNPLGTVTLPSMTARIARWK